MFPTNLTAVEEHIRGKLRPTACCTKSDTGERTAQEVSPRVASLKRSEEENYTK